MIGKFVIMYKLQLASCLLLLSASCSGVLAASSKARKTTRREHPTETPFVLSTHFPEIFLGAEHVNNPSQQAALRAKLNGLLDTVEAHYTGALRRVHELHDPKVASLLKDLLLLNERPVFSSRQLGTAGVGTDGSSASVDRRFTQEVPYKVPEQLKARLSTLPSPLSLEEWSHKIGARLAQLPAGMSFPLLRRLLTAVVVRAWLDGAGKRLTDSEEEAVSGLFVQLYMLHRRGAYNKGIMDYQHVSKSGGTSWCHAAQLNGCTTMRFDKYYVCGISAFEDKVRWVNGAAHKKLTGGEPTRWSLHGTFRSKTAPGCANRAAQMRANRWTYYSNEYTLTGGHKSMSDVEVCSKQFVTAILFRNPLRRIASHLRFLLLHYKRFMEAQVEEGLEVDFFKTYARANASFWSEVAPAITDNYFARTLLGEAAWHASVGGITTERHLPAARLVLMQYDIVVPLESPSPVTSRLLSFGAGWPVSYTDVHDKNITALQEMFDFDPTPHMPSSADLSILYHRQAVDMDLYELSVLIGQLDYLVYSTAAAAGIVPWEGMPYSLDPNDENASFRVACGLLRGPAGAWSGHLIHRRRKAGGALRDSGNRRRSEDRGGRGD